LAQFDQIGLHVRDRLIQDLDRILHATDSGVGIGTNQSAQPIEETHCEKKDPAGD
jgi:hypothetical protein